MRTDARKGVRFWFRLDWEVCPLHMNSKDALYQSAIDEEKLRLMALPTEELLALESLSWDTVQRGNVSIHYGLWHESPGYRGEDVHSFILQASRKVFLIFYRNYLAGFSINEGGEVIPISDSTLFSYD